MAQDAEVKVTVTRRSVIINWILSTIVNVLIKAIFVAIALIFLFPDRSISIPLMIFIGLLWELGSSLHFDMGFKETVRVKPTTDAGQSEEEWLAKYGINPNDLK